MVCLKWREPAYCALSQRADRELQPDECASARAGSKSTPGVFGLKKTKRRNSYAKPTSLDLNELIDYLALLGRRHAEREGVQPDDLDDCEIMFVEHMLLCRERQVRARITARSFGWIHCCARNHAVWFLQSGIRNSRLEARFPTVPISELVPQRAADNVKCPESIFIRAESWARMAAFLGKLAPEQQDLLVRHHMHGQSARELAAALGRTPHAIEQSLSRARQRLRRMLDVQGITESDLRTAAA